MKSLTPTILLFAVTAYVSADYGYRVTVNLGSGDWGSYGKMDATFAFVKEANPTRNHKVVLQPHMEKVYAGKSMTYTVYAPEPIDSLLGMSIHWRRKKMGGIFNRRSILVRSVTVEPAYLLGRQREEKTRYLCSQTHETQEIQPDLWKFFAWDCNAPIPK